MKNLVKVLPLLALMFQYGDKVQFIEPFYGQCEGVVVKIYDHTNNPLYGISEIFCLTHSGERIQAPYITRREDQLKWSGLRIQ